MISRWRTVAIPMRIQRHRAGRRELALAVVVWHLVLQPTAPVDLPKSGRNAELHSKEGPILVYTYWTEQTTLRRVLVSCLMTRVQRSGFQKLESGEEDYNITSSDIRKALI